MAVGVICCSREREALFAASVLVTGTFSLCAGAEGGATSALVVTAAAAAAATTSSCLGFGKLEGDERNISGGRASIGDLTLSIDSIVKSIIFVVLTGGSSRSILGCWMGRLPQKDVSSRILWGEGERRADPMLPRDESLLEWPLVTGRRPSLMTDEEEPFRFNSAMRSASSRRSNSASLVARSLRRRFCSSSSASNSSVLE